MMRQNFAENGFEMSRKFYFNPNGIGGVLTPWRIIRFRSGRW